MVRTNGKKIFEAVGADAVFTTPEYLKRYVTGFLTEGGFVISDEKGTTMYTDARYTEAAEKRLAGTEVKVAEVDRFDNSPAALLKKYKTVGVPFELTSYPEYKKLEGLGLTLVDSMPAFRTAMAVKNDWELAAIARACDIAEEGFLRLLPEIKEDMTETEVAALLEYHMRTLGAYSTSFDTIVAFGPHAAVPHHETGDTRLKFGDEDPHRFRVQGGRVLLGYHAHFPVRRRPGSTGSSKGRTPPSSPRTSWSRKSSFPA